MTASLFRLATLVVVGGASLACRPTPQAMFPVGGRWYEHLHSPGPAIESGWRQTDLYSDDGGTRTLVAKDVGAERYYEAQDCIVYTTGHGDAPRVTAAACGGSRPLTLDTQEYDYWRMDADGLRAKGAPDMVDGIPVIATVPIEDIKAAVVSHAPIAATVRPIDPNFVHEDTGRTLLMDVIDPATNAGSVHNRLALLRMLLTHGANVNAGDHKGVTPLMLACARDDASFVQPLIDAGATVNAADELGRTPLMIAAESFRNEAIKVRLLIEAGANVTMRDDEGHTALERVGTSANAELLSLLNAP